ncbi:uncharacterized protein LOC119317060 [Triticum dicoccoides]|uniref:uncharacterized protein LOC119317060 n=1 Tax=Triticum dicoccoides TaxID=85692 RepID=UPI00188EF554|nr:uncharacterized protein LOC119317060 [Triticum dicoccoides]
MLQEMLVMFTFELVKFLTAEGNHFGVVRIQFEGYIDSSVAATWELNLDGMPPIAVENTVSSGGGAGRVVPMAMYARNAELHAESELAEELKKIKKHLMQMIDLQKQANIMAGVLLLYHCSVFVLFVVHPSLKWAFRPVRVEDVICAPCQVMYLN